MIEMQKSSQYDNYIKAIKLIKLKRKVSTSFLQRSIKIGFGEACSIMNDLERRGFIRMAETGCEIDASMKHFWLTPETIRNLNSQEVITQIKIF